MTGSGPVGCFGKLPCVGDFVRRSLPPAFVSPWDAAFAQAVSTAREALGSRWPLSWQRAPRWRFVLAPGVCGPVSWLGVTGPAVDRVGRAFPIVLSAPVENEELVRQVVSTGAGWFEILERVCQQLAEVESVAAFESLLQNLPDPAQWAARAADEAPEALTAEALHAMRPWPQTGLDAWLGRVHDTCREVASACLWWTRGLKQFAPAVRITRGLPAASDYLDFVLADEATPEVPPTHVDADRTVPGRALRSGESARSPPNLDKGRRDSSVEPERAQACVAFDVPALAQRGGGVANRSKENVGHVAVHATSQVAWIAADNAEDGNGLSREGALAADRMLRTQLAPWDMRAACAGLRGLNSRLHERAEDLINPVLEEAAVVALCIEAGSAQFLRIGAAGVWHSRNGRCTALFPSQHANAEQDFDEVSSAGRFDMLAAPAGGFQPGLGAGQEAYCDRAQCFVEPWDRLLLVATEPLARAPMATIEWAMQGKTTDAVCMRIATAAGWDENHKGETWPMVVIEVGT